LYNSSKQDGKVLELMSLIQNDCAKAPLLLLVGTSLAKEVVDTLSLVQDFRDAGSDYY
jgi:hypothetical protein